MSKGLCVYMKLGVQAHLRKPETDTRNTTTLLRYALLLRLMGCDENNVDVAAPWCFWYSDGEPSDSCIPI